MSREERKRQREKRKSKWKGYTKSESLVEKLCDYFYEDDFFGSVYKQESENGIILKLRDIFRQEYVPVRGNQNYNKWILKEGKKRYRLAGDGINCLGHACFNLTNEIIVDYGITFDDVQALWNFDTFNKNPKLTIENISSFIEEVGLKIRKSSSEEELGENEWKIAYYFSKDKDDYHFMLQERDGRWSSKSGADSSITYFNEAPEEFVSESRQNGRIEYVLEDFYVITNPYVKTKQVNTEEEIHGGSGKV